MSRYQVWAWNLYARAPQRGISHPDQILYFVAELCQVSTVACFPPSREDPLPVSLSLREQLPCAVPVLAGEGSAMPGWHSWPGTSAMPPAARCSTLQGEISHLDGSDPRADPDYELSHTDFCNNLGIVKCSLVIETQVIWQLVKILLIINIFTSNRDFPKNGILALTGKTKSISSENHMTCLQLFAIIVFPKLFYMSCPQFASTQLFHYRWDDRREIMLIKCISTKLQGTACTMKDRSGFRMTLTGRRNGLGKEQVREGVCTRFYTAAPLILPAAQKQDGKVWVG